MIRALYTAASGMNAQQANIDNIAHNLANVNTTGLQEDAASSSRTSSTSRSRRPARRLDGGRDADRPRDRPRHARRGDRAQLHAAATCARPARPLDLAIEGAGFFQVTLPDGETGYTRAGAFHVNGEGDVVTNEGYPLEPAITIPANATSITHLEGRHRLGDRAGPGRAAAGRHASSSRTFQNPAGLEARGGNVFAVDQRVGRADDRRARHRRPRHAGAGLRRGLERQRRRGDGQHDPRAARLRGQLEGDSRRRRDAAAGQRAGRGSHATPPSSLACARAGAAGGGGRRRRPIRSPAATPAAPRGTGACATRSRRPWRERFGRSAPSAGRGGRAAGGRRPRPTGLVAVPDPGARTGRPAQFTLRAGNRRVGHRGGAASRCRSPHVRATAPVARDAADRRPTAVQEADGEVAGVRFEPLPRLDEVVGAHARRPLARGRGARRMAVVAVPDAVRAGDEVKVVARVGALEAWGVGRASGSGRVGDVVRITRGGARGLQPARVLSAGRRTGAARAAAGDSMMTRNRRSGPRMPDDRRWLRALGAGAAGRDPALAQTAGRRRSATTTTRCSSATCRRRGPSPATPDNSLGGRVCSPICARAGSTTS